MTTVNKVNVLKLIEFLPEVKHQLNDKPQDVIGGTLANGTHSWIAWGSNLVILNSTNASIRSSWFFGNGDDNSDITCVTELPVEKCQIPLLVVGISSDKCSKICIFNPNTRNIVRTLELNIQVRCICLVEDGSLINVNPLPDLLSQMKGVLAVGGADGTLLLIDLNRDFISKVLEGDIAFDCHEENPYGLNLVHPEDNASIIQLKLNHAQQNGDSLAIVLIEGNVNEDDGITALAYSRETACLYIGYSCGSWEIWNLTTFRQLYSSPESEFPVFGFGQLEPCDDPRHTVYVWVVCQSPCQSLPLTSLYSISYGKKDFVKGYGTFYEDYQQCNLVFEMSPGEEVEGIISSKIIGVETISKTLNKSSSFCIPVQDSEGTQIRLATTTYTVETKSSIETRMIIFDLNRWYAEQMPSSIEETSVVLTRAGVVRALLDLTTLSRNVLIAVNIIQRTVEAYSNPGIDTACGQISFELVGISMEGLIHVEKLGAQCQWLRNSAIVGPRSLIQPQQLYRACISSGLSVIYIDYFDFDNPTVEEMRSFILSVWLEYKMYSCILECADSWSNGSHSVAGCTLSYLLDWLWGQLIHCKTVAHHICRPLFDTCGMEFDLNERRNLQNCKMTIHSIYLLYKKILEKHSKFILSDNTENKMKAMSLLVPYMDQVVFFTTLGILPEQNHLGLPRSSVPYDYIRLQKYVSQRHLYLMRSLDDCKRSRPHMQPSQEGLYMVDSFNIVENGSKVIDYPPNSIQSLLRIWLKMDLPLEKKFALMYYFLLDLLHLCEDDKYQSCIDKITNYPFSLGMTDSQSSLVKALWNLDHSFYEDGVRLLMSSQVLASDLTDSQNRSILRLLFLESKYNLAHQYLKTKHPALHLPEDLKFEMSLLLANQLISEAHIFQRKNIHLRESLLAQFFSEQDFNQLMHTINLNLDRKEETCFIKFLNDQNNSKYDDLHVLLLISRAKYMEAVELHRKLKAQKGSNSLSARDRFVKGISSSLTSVNKLISNEENLFKNFPLPSGGKKPLSVYVKTSMEQGFPATQKSNNAVAAFALICAKKSWKETVNGTFPFSSNTNKLGIFSGPKLSRETIEVQPLPAPPSPFLHRKRMRPVDEKYISNAVLHQRKKLKIEERMDSIDKKEVEELLATPVIERRRPREHLHAASLNNLPHSILKKIGDGRTKTPVKAANDTSEQVEYLTPRKLLRFTLPLDEAGNTEELKTASSIRVSARRSLRPLKNDVDNSMDMSTPSGSSTSSSLSILDGSDQSNKELVASTPLRKLQNINNEDIDWTPIMDAAQPKTLFSIGAGSSTVNRKRKSLLPAVNNSNKTYLDSFIKKMGLKPRAEDESENDDDDDEKRKNHLSPTEEHEVEIIKKDEDYAAISNANSANKFLHSNYSFAKNKVQRSAQGTATDLDSVSKSRRSVTPSKDSIHGMRTRFGGILKGVGDDLDFSSNNKVVKRRLDKSDEEGLVEIKQPEFVEESKAVRTPTRCTKRIQLHIEKKVRLEVQEEVQEKENEDDEVYMEEKIVVNTEEKKIEEVTLEEEDLEDEDVTRGGTAVPCTTKAGLQDLEGNIDEKEDDVKEDNVLVANEEIHSESESEDDNLADFQEKNDIENANRSEDFNDKVISIDEEVEEEKNKNMFIDEVLDSDQQKAEFEDVGSSLNVTAVCSLSGAISADFHTLTAVQPEANLGEESSVNESCKSSNTRPFFQDKFVDLTRSLHNVEKVKEVELEVEAVSPTTQPLQYFTEDRNEEDDLYSGLEEAEEAEIPQKMDFHQPEEGFDGIYDDELYEQHDPLGSPVINSRQKSPEAESESSVICLDSDSEAESHTSAKETVEATKLIYEGDDLAEGEEESSNSASSPVVRSRSFFHDKFVSLADTGCNEDKADIDEEEESDAESIQSVSVENEEDDVEEEEDEDEVEDEEEGDEERELDDQAVGDSQSEDSADSSEPEELEVSESNKTPLTQTDLTEKRNKEKSIYSPKDEEMEIISEMSHEMRLSKNENQTDNAVFDPIDSENNKQDGTEGFSPGFKRKNVPSKQKIETDSSGIQENKKIDEFCSMSFRIAELNSADKNEHIEELCLSPIIEMEDSTIVTSNEAVISQKNSQKTLNKDNEIDEQTLAALSLKRVDHTEVIITSELSVNDERAITSTIPTRENRTEKTSFVRDLQECMKESKTIELSKNVETETLAKSDEQTDSIKSLGSELGITQDPEESKQCKTEIVEEVFAECYEDVTEITQTLKKNKKELCKNEEEAVDKNAKAKMKKNSEENEVNRPGKNKGIEVLENVIDKVDLSVVETEKKQTMDKQKEKVDTTAVRESENETGKVGSSVKLKEFADQQIVDLKEYSGVKNYQNVPDIELVDSSKLSVVERKCVTEKNKKNDKNKKQSDKIPADIFALGEGQMFFGSPENLKTSASELATFQVGRSSLTNSSDENKSNNNDNEARSDDKGKSSSDLKDITGARDISETSSTMNYTLGEMDVAMILANTPCSINTPPVTPQFVSTRKRKYRSDTPWNVFQQRCDAASDDIELTGDEDIIVDSQPCKKDTQDQIMVEANSKQPKSFLLHSESTSQTKHTRKSLDVARIYPEKSKSSNDGKRTQRVSSTKEPCESKIHAKRSLRASSEQPASHSKKVSEDNDRIENLLQTRHTRKSLDVARIYPDKTRSSTDGRRRLRASSEQPLSHVKPIPEDEANYTTENQLQTRRTKKSIDVAIIYPEKTKSSTGSKRSQRASSEQPISSHGENISEDNDRVENQLQAKHTRKSLDVARIYPEIARSSSYTKRSQRASSEQPVKYDNYRIENQELQIRPRRKSSLRVPIDDGKRGKRASSEQPISLNDKFSRKSVDVGRMFQEKPRSSIRRRTSSESSDVVEDIDPVFSKNNFESDPSIENSEEKQRKRRSSASNKHRTELSLEENKKASELQNEPSLAHCTSFKEEESYETPVKRNRSRSRRSSSVFNLMEAISEEETPISIESRPRVDGNEEVTKKRKPVTYADGSKEAGLTKGISRSKRASSVPADLKVIQGRKSSSKTSFTLDRLDEDDREDEEYEGTKDSTKIVPKTSTRARCRNSPNKSNRTSETLRGSEEMVSDISIQKKPGKTSSLPDLSSRRKVSTRLSKLPKLDEVNEEESGDEHRTPSRRSSLSTTASEASHGLGTSSSTAAVAGTQLTCPTSSVIESTFNNESLIVTNNAVWADKLYGKTQAKWWAKLGKMKNKEQEEQELITNSEVHQQPSKSSRSGKHGGGDDTLSVKSENIGLRLKKDVESSSAKSEKIGRSSRSRKETLLSKLDSSEKSERVLRSRREVETTPVKSDKGSARSPGRRKKNIDVSPPSSEKSSGRSRRKSEVEILLAQSPHSSETSGARTRRTRVGVEDSPNSSEHSVTRRGRRKKEPSSPGVAGVRTLPVINDEEESTRDSKMEQDVTNIVEEYAENRRLTRHQKNLLERSLSSTESAHISPLENKKSDEMESSDSEEDTIFTPVKSKKNI